MGGRLIVTKNTSPFPGVRKQRLPRGQARGGGDPAGPAGREAGALGSVRLGEGRRRGACPQLSLSLRGACVSPTNTRVPGCVCHAVPRSRSCVCD